MPVDTIQVIIQGGAVGLALSVVGGTYLIIQRSMGLINIFLTNHIAHLTAALDKNTEVLEKLEDTIHSLDRRM